MMIVNTSVYTIIPEVGYKEINNFVNKIWQLLDIFIVVTGSKMQNKHKWTWLSLQYGGQSFTYKRI